MLVKIVCIDYYTGVISSSTQWLCKIYLEILSLQYNVVILQDANNPPPLATSLFSMYKSMGHYLACLYTYLSLVLDFGIGFCFGLCRPTCVPYHMLLRRQGWLFYSPLKCLFADPALLCFLLIFALLLGSSFLRAYCFCFPFSLSLCPSLLGFAFASIWFRFLHLMRCYRLLCSRDL